jgi:hypothetical protein
MQSGETLPFSLAICSARASRFSKVLISILDCFHFCVVLEFKRGLNPCQAFFQWSLLQSAEKDTGQVAHSVCNPRIELAAPDQID